MYWPPHQIFSAWIPFRRMAHCQRVKHFPPSLLDGKIGWRLWHRFLHQCLSAPPLGHCTAPPLGLGLFTWNMLLAPCYIHAGICSWSLRRREAIDGLAALTPAGITMSISMGGGGNQPGRNNYPHAVLLHNDWLYFSGTEPCLSISRTLYDRAINVEALI